MAGRRLWVTDVTGIITWLVATGLGHAQVNPPEGFELVEFGISPRLNDEPRMNDCGQVVFGENIDDGWALYLYDNGSIRRLARERTGWLPWAAINDHGTIVYTSGKTNEYGSHRVVQIDGRRKRRIGVGSTPSINNRGDIAARWYRGECDVDFDIGLFEGGRGRRLSNDPHSDQSVTINDRGEAIWTRYSFCSSPTWTSEIALYTNGEVIYLPKGDPQSQLPHLNNLGQAVWTSPIGVESWEDGVTTLVSDRGGAPRVNDLGDIVFNRWDEDRETHDWWMYRVSTGEPAFYQLTADHWSHTQGDINNWTESVWRFMAGRGNYDGGIHLLRRIRTGDSEFDGDIDLTDYGALSECLSGPGRVDGLCDCRFMDIDHDGDVDLGDFARFQNAYDGAR